MVVMESEIMVKLIEIQNCGVCPHCTFLGGYKCAIHNNRYISDKTYPKIPDWCTLPDAKIIDKYNFSDADGVPE